MAVIAREKISKKDSILAAAIRQVADGGVSSVTIRTLAAEVGGASGALYYHFKDLDEVIIAVNSKTVAMLDAALTEAVDRGGTVAEVFERLALAYLHFAIDHPKRFAALFDHAMAAGAPIPEWHLAENYALFRHVETQLETLDPDLAEEDRKALARTIYSAVHGIVHMGLHGRMISVPVPVIETQLRLVTRLLAGGLRHVGAALQALAA